MRIAYLAPDPVPAPKGAGVRIRRTVETLRDLGHEVALFTPATATPASLDGIDHTEVSLDQPNFLDRQLGFRAAAAGWLDGRAADVVWFRSIWEGVAAIRWARQRGARVVYEAHGFPSVELPGHYPGLLQSPSLLDKLIVEENACLAAADRLLTPSATGRRYLLSRGVRAARIAIVGNAVDPDLFSPDAVPPPDGVPYRVLYQGTLAPWQGLDTLLEALVRFRSEGRVELHVAGPLKSVWRRALKSRARQLRVHHLLHLSGAVAQRDLVPALRTAHVCVAPLPADPRNALMGPCPIKLLEYMACARPILATAIAPVEEILEDGRDARLVRPSSPAALAAGLAWMLDEPKAREELGARAREQALARWTPRHFTAQLAAAIEPLHAE